MDIKVKERLLLIINDSNKLKHGFYKIQSRSKLFIDMEFTRFDEVIIIN